MFDFQMFVRLLSLYRRPPLTEVELKETFELLDRDRSGAVDAAEIRQLLTCLGHSLSQDEVGRGTAGHSLSRDEVVGGRWTACKIFSTFCCRGTLVVAGSVERLCWGTSRDMACQHDVHTNKQHPVAPMGQQGFVCSWGRRGLAT